MKNYGSTPLSASELCGLDKPFDGLTFVEEANYTQLVKRLNEICPYSLSGILDSTGCGTQKMEVLAALGIANLFHDKDITYVEEEDELVGVVCPNHEIMVVPEHKMFADTLLQPWLCSTTILPDIAVYPYLNGEDVLQVQVTNIPYFLAEYYSKNMLATARQCAIKSIILLQLNRLHGCTENKVIGFALPQMSPKADMSLILQEANEEQELVEQVNELSLQDSAATSNKKKKATKKTKLNAVVQVTVEWNFKALRFVVTYTVLEEENAASVIKDVLKNQIQQMQECHTIKDYPSMFIKLTDMELLAFKCIVVQLLAKEWESENTELSSFVKDEGKLKLHLESCSYVNWKEDCTEIEQYNSSISLVFKLINTNDGTNLFLKSFSRPSMQSHLAIIERHLTKSKVQRSLCSSYIIDVSFTAFHVFRGLHHIYRETAKDCLIDFLQSVKKAVDELHSHDVAHLDIRLANVCLRKTSDGKFEAVLIDLERCKQRITSLWKEEVYNGCMYKGTCTLEQLDYVQVFWMAFWILLSPADVDYHEMDKINSKDLTSKGKECQDIWDFIGNFIKAPTNWDAHLDDIDTTPWSNFIGKIESTSTQLRCSCRSTLVVM